MQGDVSLNAEDKPPLKIELSNVAASGSTLSLPNKATVHEAGKQEKDDCRDGQEESHTWLEGHMALKFLLAGGIAGAGKWEQNAP